jgi:N-acetylneuraminate synthase
VAWLNYILEESNMSVTISGRNIGSEDPCYVVAEIGINHNGDLEIAKRLIDVAVSAGCEAVKFQKRTVDVVYTAEELKKPRENPFGPTNGDLKRALEFGKQQYQEIDAYCKEKGIVWFASPWDEASVDFLEEFNVPCHKVASASLTDDNLLRCIRSTGKPVILSTGMSTMEQIDHAVAVLGRDELIILHATSTYPANYDELNLKVIPVLADRFQVPVGYSGHETGIASSVAAVALGASMVERHLTLDRAMWGSDQAASLEPNGITRLLRDIRLVETAFGDGKKRMYEREVPVMEKLRRVGR